MWLSFLLHRSVVNLLVGLLRARFSLAALLHGFVVNFQWWNNLSRTSLSVGRAHLSGFRFLVL